MKYIDVDYDVVREGTVIFEGYATVGITDKNVKEVAEFIRDNHFSGELVDVPSHVYDRIVNAVNYVAGKDLKTELKTCLYESDEVRIQTVLPMDLLNMLPEDVRELIDMGQIDEYYAESEDESDDEIEEGDDLNDWNIGEEEREEPNKENTLYLTIKQVFFDQIMSGEKTEEYREIKDTTYKKYLALDENGGLLSYENHVFDDDGVAEHLFNAWNNGVFPFIPKNIQYLDLAVGYNKERDTARVEVIGCRFMTLTDGANKAMRYSFDKKDQLVYDPEGNVTQWIIAIKLGKVLDCHRAKK